MEQWEVKMLENYVNDMKSLYGKHLIYVILYGSRARGDFREDSDYDIMLLVDLDDDSIKDLYGRRIDLDCEYDRKYDVYISAHVRNVEFFKKWVRSHPFYNNVWNEGVALYETTSDNG